MSAEEVEIRPAYVEARNASDSTMIGFEKRWARVQKVHQLATGLPPSLAEAVGGHQQSLDGPAVGMPTVQATRQIYSVLADIRPRAMASADALDVLESLLDVSPDMSPDIPIVDEIAMGDIEGRLRAASDLRLAKARGHTSRLFSQQVREAYNHTCAFCGLRLPSGPAVLSGVDAAHILAWSEYDLDVLGNGICLCKNHHWAFDQAILSIQYRHPIYRVEATPRIELYDRETQAEILRSVGEIPPSRLPSNVSSRPSPTYLAKLYTDIDVTAFS